jgi:MOSC domain-containing protein
VVGHLDVGLDAGMSDGLRVLELWRYPVKSLLGQRLEHAEVGPQGIPGDRGWALLDVAGGELLTARRAPDMLFATGRLRPDGDVEVVLPDGTVTADDEVLSAWIGRPVGLRPAVDGAFHDEGPDARLTLVSTGTLGSWDRRRFRPNVVLAGEGEDALVGSPVRLGTAELDVVMQVPRCVMTTRPQAGGIGRDTSVLKTVHRERGGDLAVGARVTRPGGVAVGDVLARV